MSNREHHHFILFFSDSPHLFFVAGVGWCIWGHYLTTPMSFTNSRDLGEREIYIHKT